MGQNSTKANENHNNEEVKKDREQLLQVRIFDNLIFYWPGRKPLI